MPTSFLCVLAINVFCSREQGQYLTVTSRHLMDKVEQNKVNDTISDDIVLQSKKKAMKAYRWEVIDTIYCFLISFAPFALAILFWYLIDMNHDVVTTIHL